MQDADVLAHDCAQLVVEARHTVAFGHEVALSLGSTPLSEADEPESVGVPGEPASRLLDAASAEAVAPSACASALSSVKASQS